MLMLGVVVAVSLLSKRVVGAVVFCVLGVVEMQCCAMISEFSISVPNPYKAKLLIQETRAPNTIVKSPKRTCPQEKRMIPKITEPIMPSMVNGIASVLILLPILSNIINFSLYDD